MSHHHHHNASTAAAPQLADVVASFSYPELEERKEIIHARLKEITIEEPAPPPKKKAGAKRPRSTTPSNGTPAADGTSSGGGTNLVPLPPPKTDTHWDFVMKEMMWLAADFMGERKRQHTFAKKAANGIKQFHKTKETRRVRLLAEAELKRRRLAAKQGRQLRAWWTKIERVIAYKQKLSADGERRKAMNQQLVDLVRTTERYGETLATAQVDDDEKALSIEEALAAADRLRSRNVERRDYSQLKMADEEIYGHSTTSESGSDGSFVVDSNDEDDETTLRQAEVEETRERRRRQPHGSSDDGDSYLADPDEIKKLQEESSMDVDKVLDRMKEEAEHIPDVVNDPEDDSSVVSTKKVTFAADVVKRSRRQKALRRAPSPRHRTASSQADPGHDADDDADASDVEDFVDVADGDGDGSDEFQADENEVDDETTIAAEERLGRDMSAEDEINLLQQESEVSIEELRMKYAALQDSGLEEECVESEVEDTKMPAQDLENAALAAVEERFKEDDAEDEFQPTNEVDDETTIEAEERLGREMSPDQEISVLEAESEIPIEQLRAMYAQMSKEDEEDDDPNPDEIEITQPVESMEEDSSYRNLLAKADDVGDDVEEFVPEMMEADDETTMEAEERLGRDMSYEAEIKLLQRESEMSVDELRKLYGAITGGAEESADDEIDEMSSAYEGDDGEDEFKPDENAVDDETTLEAEERLGREMSTEAEIALLKRESETPVEELRAMYASMQAKDGDSSDRNDSKRRRVDKNQEDGEQEEDGMVALGVLEASVQRARNTTASRPFLLSSWVKLRKYQQIGLNWLVSIQTRRLNGILADEMGLGKTLQTISLLSYLASYKGIWGPHIVVVPTSVIMNWETELKRFCPGLKVLCYYGSAKRRKELRTGWTKANWYHVVITSYQLAVQDAFAFKRKKWYYMILDEAHNIKNFQSQRWQTLISFNSQRRLLLTGTPLQNNLTELWSLLHFLMPHVFRSRKEFSYWFSNPMNNIIEGNSKRSDDLISRLHGIIRPFVLRRLKKDVEKQLPGKYEHFVPCQMSRRQMFLYEEFMARSSTRQSLKKGGNFMGMMNVLMQLRKVCNHPDLFEPRAVITPFAMRGVTMTVPKLVTDFFENNSDLWSTTSDFVRSPLWCGSGGLLCASRSLEHDVIMSEQLSRLKAPAKLFVTTIKDTDIGEPLPADGASPGLAKHLEEVWQKERKGTETRRTSQGKTNERRCTSEAFSYPRRLQQSVTLSPQPWDQAEADVVQDNRGIVSTPQQLLLLRKSTQARADDLDELVKKFVFCIPKAGVSGPRRDSSKKAEKITSSFKEMLLEPVEEYLKPFRHSKARLSSFFPDKRLIQFDAGKLQTLSGLLHDLKRGGHRALIFTQMSKMLDILEAFLNLNGHTYLRLDGSTGVDRRQRLMDKFNNDDKVFCFILSTRSGGLGINLTGADTVIFYDSDWNPAMDAQAQDRAHRIGQTRDVHIYRLITQHSIEENIWTKAKQKRNLDLIVMDEGKFDASKPADEIEEEDNNGLKDLYSKGGLRDILGVHGDEKDDTNISNVPEHTPPEMTSEQLEKAMTSLEDADDAVAMQNAKKEAEDDLKEFDETVAFKKDSDDDMGKEVPSTADKTKAMSASETDDPVDKTTTDDDDEDKEENKKEEDMVKEFNAWQNTVGVDASTIEASLSSTERYGLRFRETIDPFWSVFAIMEERRRLEAEEDDANDVDIDALERDNAIAEQQALQDGDLLGTNPRPEELPRQRHVYQREKARFRAGKKRRKLTGENWVERTDGVTKHPFWYNEDTGEAIWEKPKVLLELEAEEVAHEKRWNAMPLRPLVNIMSFLISFPDRMSCSLACRQWKCAATDASFVLHVLPVELSATHSSRNLPNHYGTIADAMQVAHPGDMIELGDGHYWVNDPGLDIKFPLKIVGDEHNPAHVVIELSGSVRWNAKGGFLEGVTFRRPKIATTSQAEVLVVGGGKLDMVHCVLDNEGSNSDVVSMRNGKGHWFDIVMRGSGKGHGLHAIEESFVQLDSCQLVANHECGIFCSDKSHIQVSNCEIERNGGYGFSMQRNSKGEVTRSRFAHNVGGILEKEAGSTCVPCSGNVAVVATKTHRPVPGFRLVRESDDNQGQQ